MPFQLSHFSRPLTHSKDNKKDVEDRSIMQRKSFAKEIFSNDENSFLKFDASGESNLKTMKNTIFIRFYEVYSTQSLFSVCFCFVSFASQKLLLIQTHIRFFLL